MLTDNLRALRKFNARRKLKKTMNTVKAVVKSKILLAAMKMKKEQELEDQNSQLDTIEMPVIVKNRRSITVYINII